MSLSQLIELGKRIEGARRGIGWVTFTDATRDNWIEFLSEWRQQCHDLGFWTAENAAARAVKNLKAMTTQVSTDDAGKPVRERLPSFSSRSELRQIVQDFEVALTTDLEAHGFVAIPQAAYRYLARDLFGAAVVERFPSAADDIESAGRCLALRLYTAGVFHLMRVLETGLRTLAASLELTIDDASWGPAIDQIETKIKALNSKGGPNWREQLQFCSEAAVQFRYFKDAWRNHVMHARSSYDQTRAMEIFAHVKAFMQHLSSELREPTP